MKDNFVYTIVAKTVVITWYEAGYVDPSDRGDDPLVRPYGLSINGGNEQHFTSEEKRTAYLDWYVSLAKK